MSDVAHGKAERPLTTYSRHPTAAGECPLLSEVTARAVGWREWARRERHYVALNVWFRVTRWVGFTATLGRKRSLDRAIGIAGISARFDRLENRLDGLESRVGILEDRVTGLERRMAGLEKGMDGIARSNHPIETMPADILTRLSAT